MIFDAIKDLVKPLGVEEFLQLVVENAELVLEALAVVAILDSIPHVFASSHITWFGAPVKLLFECNSYFIFQIRRNVISLSNCSDSCHWYRAGELVRKTWQLRFEKSNNVAVGFASRGLITLGFLGLLIIDKNEFGITNFENAQGIPSLVIWSKMPLFSAFNVASTYEIEISRSYGQSFSPETRKPIPVILILIQNTIHELKLSFPRNMRQILLNNFLN